MSEIRAIEIGFGTLSFTKRVSNGVPEIDTFSSVVVPVGGSGDLSGGLSRRNTVLVEVDGEHYEVGPDAQYLNDRTSSRTLNHRYVDTPQFKALFKAALLMMDTDSIDMLVLALPVNNMKRADDLKEFATGDHVVNGRRVKVNDVWILCQPLAGFFAYADQIGQAAFNRLQDTNVLCLDFGFTTSDWLVTRGLKVNYKKSGAKDMGMSAVLESCSESLSNSKVFSHLDDIADHLIDEAFYKHPGKLIISGREYDFPYCEDKGAVLFDCRNAITNVTNGCMQEVRNNVGAGADIGLIIVMGGPHQVYLDAVKEHYPTHRIEVVREPLTAVCRGMFSGGVQYQRALSKKKVA